MKDLPKSILQQRKKFKKLTDKLKHRNVRFRWEILEGLSFGYRDTKTVIRWAGKVAILER